MSWWNRANKPFLFIIGVLTVIGITVVVMRLRGPRIGSTFCTLAGCFGGLGIVVEGLPAGTVYDLNIKYVHGHEQILTCQIGKDSDGPASPFVHGCVPDGAAFTLSMDEKPPEEITVILTANGKKFTKVFRPTYEEYYPNGKDCTPVCYTSTVVMDVSK